MTTDVTTAPDGDLYYRYGEPENKSSKMLLLHKHGCAVIGEWGKGLGWIAWCPLPRRKDVIWHEKRSFCMKNSYEPTRVLLTGDARFDLLIDERLKSYRYLGPNNLDTVMDLEIRITITDIPNGVEVY